MSGISMHHLLTLCLAATALAEPPEGPEGTEAPDAPLAPPDARPPDDVPVAPPPAGSPIPAEPAADPGAPVELPTEPPADDTFVGVLERAKESYFRGETMVARELLQGLQLRLYAGEDAPAESVTDALTYLGEIHYLDGRQDQAEIAFRYLLERDPNTPISPYSHSQEVVNLFERVRGEVLAAQTPPVPLPPPPPPPVPVWVFTPFGVPQFSQRRPVAGLVYGTLQAGLATASIGLQVHLTRTRPITVGSLAPDDPILVSGNREKYLMQWPATFGFYLLWGVSTADAIRWHQRQHTVAPVIGATPSGTAVLGVGGAL